MDMSNYDHFITARDQIISGFPLCHIVITEDRAKHVQSEGLNIASAVGDSFCVREFSLLPQIFELQRLLLILIFRMLLNCLNLQYWN
jgi:hypothetical protein